MKAYEVTVYYRYSMTATVLADDVDEALETFDHLDADKKIKVELGETDNPDVMAVQHPT